MKIYLSRINESWIIDRIRKEWLENNPSLSTKFIYRSDIIWIISPWLWKNLPKRQLAKKKVICSHYHFDFDIFDKKDFYELDEYVDEYHVISNKTLDQLKTLTNKKITSIPFWIDQKKFYEINNKDRLRQEFGFVEKDYLVGSFQRDTEGSDNISPKLIKGPDIFVEKVKELKLKNENLMVVLAGKRRNYIIKELKKLNISYKYFEMVNAEALNKLYNILDLYLVTSRIEGGPQAILECAITKTPILSTNVGVAGEILHSESLYEPKNFYKAKTNVEHAYNNALRYKLPEGMNLFKDMIFKFYEN
ncbi:glycosyltransferase [Acidimicrobiaceae bacterium]|nr:glycosyltransferase [Acidimicrobiaceae bacterium]